MVTQTLIAINASDPETLIGNDIYLREHAIDLENMSLSPQEESAAIRVIQNSNRHIAITNAFINYCYRRYCKSVFGIVHSISPAIDEQDVMQNVIMKIWENIHLFRHECKLSSWIFRITVNATGMLIRKKEFKYTEQLQGSRAFHKRYESHCGNTDSRNIELRILAFELLNQLPPGYRSVLTLHDYEGYEHEEISAIKGISSGTSKSQLHKAREKSKKILQPT